MPSAAEALGPPDTAIVVLTWNGLNDTLACLASIESNANGCTVVLVDNGSTDGTVDHVRRRFPWVEIIENDTNLGFAAGNNRGIERALARQIPVIGVLNNDTVVRPGFLQHLLSVIAENPELVYVSPLIRYLRDPNGVWFGGAEVKTRSGIFVHRQFERGTASGRTATPMITGCALFAHRAVWSKVGLFDERYFLIFEDADWSSRANTAGCAGIVANDSVLLHEVSSTISAHASSAADYYYARNGLLYLRDHPQPGSLAGFWFVLECLRQSLRQLKTERSLRTLATPVLQTLGFIDSLRGRWGPLSDGRVTRWSARSGNRERPAQTGTPG